MLKPNLGHKDGESTVDVTPITTSLYLDGYGMFMEAIINSGVSRSLIDLRKARKLGLDVQLIT